MASDRGSNERYHPLNREYRLRFIYCSVAAVVLCLGVITFVSAVVIYILSSTSASHSSPPFINDILYHQRENQFNPTPVVVALVLGAIGTAFITISMVFAFLACLSNSGSGTTADHCPPSATVNANNNNNNHNTNNNHSTILQPKTQWHNPQDSHGKHEQEQLLSPTSDQSGRTATKPQTTSKQSASAGGETPVSRYTVSMTPSTVQGDINTIGLPPVAPRRVPPNGFSYLAHPSEIHAYHENHRLTPIRPQHRQTPNSASRESEI